MVPGLYFLLKVDERGWKPTLKATISTRRSISHRRQTPFFHSADKYLRVFKTNFRTSEIERTKWKLRRRIYWGAVIGEWGSYFAYAQIFKKGGKKEYSFSDIGLSTHHRLVIKWKKRECKIEHEETISFSKQTAMLVCASPMPQIICPSILVVLYDVVMKNDSVRNETLTILVHPRVICNEKHARAFSGSQNGDLLLSLFYVPNPKNPSTMFMSFSNKLKGKYFNFSLYHRDYLVVTDIIYNSFDEIFVIVFSGSKVFPVPITEMRERNETSLAIDDADLIEFPGNQDNQKFYFDNLGNLIQYKFHETEICYRIITTVRIHKLLRNRSNIHFSNTSTSPSSFIV
jgi:hypothetical protein